MVGAGLWTIGELGRARGALDVMMTPYDDGCGSPTLALLSLRVGSVETVPLGVCCLVSFDVEAGDVPLSALDKEVGPATQPDDSAWPDVRSGHDNAGVPGNR